MPFWQSFLILVLRKLKRESTLSKKLDSEVSLVVDGCDSHFILSDLLIIGTWSLLTGFLRTQSSQQNKTMNGRKRLTTPRHCVPARFAFG